LNGKGYRYVWGAADGPLTDGSYASSIVKLDLHERGRRARSAMAIVCIGEPSSSSVLARLTKTMACCSR
jgi:hypothetical protein